VELTLVAVVVVALFFDFTNGFHDTANSIATSVSTRALSPRLAVLTAAVLNFAGAFVSIKVAATVAKGIVDPEAITLKIVLGGLVGAITWNLITWYLGLPSSSSHALIGGMIGSANASRSSIRPRGSRPRPRARAFSGRRRITASQSRPLT
jgi:PiT family inorganic phosphate transporter